MLRVLGIAVCVIRGHVPTLWSRPPDGAGPLIFCLRCTQVLDRLN